MTLEARLHTGKFSLGGFTKLKAYFELTKPKVTVLNMLVSIVTFILASAGGVNWADLALFSVAAYLVVGGCGAVNCYYDRDIDAVMDRTARRALPTRRVAALNALAIGLASMIVGFIATYVLFGLTTLVMVALGAVFYLLVYTVWLKRTSRWNVLIGAVSGGFAATAGWAATGNSFTLIPILIGILDIVWTPGHLWSLAIKRVEEYAKAGIPMLPTHSGIGYASKFVLLFNATTVAFSFVFTLLGETGLIYTVVAAACGAWLLWKSVKLYRNPSVQLGHEAYLASMPYLAALMASFLIDRIAMLRL